ncbi:hypothetical protein KBA63_01755 [Candidatus Woesebacteria bacterium]|jgi:protein involved in sex pheromone biosynthesis|nr:hypothetical protein [Candidatus Woesebacteria bacterium]MBP9687495.1 hypothetical protein [Candidatus Woesebacteria bacterium]
MNNKRIVQTKSSKKKFVLGYIIVCLAITIVLGTRQASVGNSYYRVESKIATLEQQGRDIREEIVSKASLTTLSEKATNLGYNIPKDFIYAKASGIGLASR